MKKITLNNGVDIPLLGFGVFQIADLQQCERAVIDAIAAGYRAIDTAESYMNEAAVGRAVRVCGVPREELFITTKLWLHHTPYDLAVRAIDDSLKRLQLDYLDLHLIHQPFNDVHGAWRAMEMAYKAGKIRAIGVSNFHSDRLMDIKGFHEIPPAINQIEINPFYQQDDSVRYMQEIGVQPQAWAPFAEGRNNFFTHPVLVEIARKHNKTVAQIVVNWLIGRNILVLTKTIQPARMAENLAVFDFQIDAEDVAKIAALDTGQSCFFSHRDPAIVKWMSERKLGG